MTDVEIQYCVPCGHLPRAQDLQEELLEEYGQGLDGVRLKTGDSGVFTVSVDGEQIFDKADAEYDPDAIVAQVGEHVGATA